MDYNTFRSHNANNLDMEKNLKKYLLLLIALLPILIISSRIGLILAVVLAVILVVLMPSAFNIAVSYVAVKWLNLALSVKILIFLMILIIVSFNVRLTGIVSDLYYNLTEGEEVKIIHKVIVPITDPISIVIKNGDQIEYRTNPMSTFTLGYNPETDGLHIGLPPTSKVDIENYLLSKGFLIQKNGDAITKLILDVQDNGYTVTVDISIRANFEETAHYSNRFRKAYFLESHGELAHYKKEYDKITTAKKFIMALSQDTIWNKVLVTVLHNKYKSNPITEFIDRAIEIEEQPAPYEKTLEAKVSPANQFEEAFPLDKAYGSFQDYHSTIVKNCENNYANKSIVMPFPDTHYFILSSQTGQQQKVFFKKLLPSSIKVTGYYEVRKVICLEDEIIVVLFQNITTKFYILRYSLNGDCLGIYNVRVNGIGISPTNHIGIVDFKKGPDYYEFILLELDGHKKRILSERIISFEK